MTPKLAALAIKARNHFKQRWVGILVGLLVPTVLGFILVRTIAGEYLTRWSYDRPFMLRGAIEATNAVVVYLDEASHNELHQPYDRPWDRSLHAKLLKRLTAAKAKAVVFDIVFFDQGPNAGADDSFADAITDAGNVILAADAVPLGAGTSGRHYDAPYKPFRDAAKDRLGSAEYIPDADLMIRRYLVGLPDGLVPSEAWAAAEFVGAPVASNPALRTNTMYVNHYGPPGTIPHISFWQVVSDDQHLDPDFFRDKVVFIGAKTVTKFSGERKDEYSTPFSALAIRQGYDLRYTSGAEIHATAFLNLLRGDWLRRFSPTTELWLIIAFGAFCGVLLVSCRPLAAVLVGLALAILVTAVNYALFTQKYTWFPWLIPVLIQIPVAVVWSVTYNSVQLLVQNRLLEQSLGKHLSPKRVKQLRDRPEFLLQPGAQKQNLTILFSDIENFSHISEGMDSDELAKLMNRYFESAVTDCIHKTDGTVVKYIGDAIFSFWNAPEQQNDHAVRACEAALLLRQQKGAYNKNGSSYPLRTRIGLHTGEANVGNFGSATRIDYTAIGENINLASRLEGLNKFLGTDILITDDTKNGLGDKFITRLVGKFRLKGFERAVDVYELVGTADAAEQTKPWRDGFEKALHLFQTRQFEAAQKEFSCVLQKVANDGPTRYYLRYMEEMAADTLPVNWRGEIELREK